MDLWECNYLANILGFVIFFTMQDIYWQSPLK